MQRLRLLPLIAGLAAAMLLSACGTLERCAKGFDGPADSTAPAPHG